MDFCATTVAARYVYTFNNNHSNIPSCPFFIVTGHNFKNSLRSKLFRASFLQETKFVEGKKKRKEWPGGANSRNNSIGNACYAGKV